MKLVPKVSIGTTAYNEARTIKQMLTTVSRQKENDFLIKEILVISDGSTDDTVEIIKRINDQRIKIIDHRERKGKPARIAELFQCFEGDYLILIDADLIMSDNKVSEKLITKCLSDKNIGLVAAHLRPLQAETFLESAVNNYRYAREKLENGFSFGQRIWGAHGCLVYSRKFAKSLIIPNHVLSDDSFSYYSCISSNYKFGYVNDAVVFYRSPQTLKDYISQATRHYLGGLQLYNYFDQKFIDYEKKVPLFINIRLMLYQLSSNFFGYIFLRIINIYCIYQSKRIIKNYNVKWQTVMSSKKI